MACYGYRVWTNITRAKHSPIKYYIARYAIAYHIIFETMSLDRSTLHYALLHLNTTISYNAKSYYWYHCYRVLVCGVLVSFEYPAV